MERDPSNGRVLIQLRVVNQGRGEIDVAGFFVTPYRSSKPVLEILEIMKGRSLPYRVAGGSEESWTVDVVQTAKKYDAGLRDKTIKPWSSRPEQMYFSVKGGGKFVHAKSQRYDARKLIADALWRPDDE